MRLQLLRRQPEQNAKHEAAELRRARANQLADDYRYVETVVVSNTSYQPVLKAMSEQSREQPNTQQSKNPWKREYFHNDRNGLSVSGDAGLRVLRVVSDEVNDWRWTPNPKTVETIGQRLDGVATFNLMGGQVLLCRGRIARDNLKPDLRLDKVLTAVEPQIAAAKLEDVAGQVSFEQRQAESVTVEGERRFKNSRGQLDGNVRATVKSGRIHKDDASNCTLAEWPGKPLPAQSRRLQWAHGIGIFVLQFAEPDGSRTSRICPARPALPWFIALTSLPRVILETKLTPPSLPRVILESKLTLPRLVSFPVKRTE